MMSCLKSDPWRASWLLSSLLLVLGPSAQAEPPVVQLSRQGQAKLPLVISAGASEKVKRSAETLAHYLGRITGAKFDVRRGDGRSGLALGTAEDFTALDVKKEFSLGGFADDEQYVLRSHQGGLCAVGATEAAVEHAVWDLLYRVGYRAFFPGETWEVVPRIDELAIAVDVHQRPDYAVRRIWYGYGTWDYNEEPLAQWQARNRAPGTFALQSGHIYDRILSRNRKEFAAHPEYRALVNGQRTSTKFCVSNPGLRELVLRDALERLREAPEEPSISIEPSDGPGWCECEGCQALGSPSNRALILANQISAVLERDHPQKYVALYAYNQHSPPPSIQARPRVIVSCATSFIKDGLTIDQLIGGWKERGVAQFGIREYYGVNVWDRDLPAEGRGGQLDYLAETIPRFHRSGARFLSAESSDNWGPNGLGYYIATRILWDVDEAQHVDSLVADFLEKAFGPAREPMAAYYRLLNGPEKPLLSHDLVGRMYGLLGDASDRAGDPGVQARIDQLVLYTRYVELFRNYSNAKGDQRQAAFEQLIRHAYRMRKTMMIHTKALYRDLPNRDKSVRVPAEAQWNVPEGKNPWKSSEPWTPSELARLMKDGIAANPLARFEPVPYDWERAPAKWHSPTGAKRLDDSEQGRRAQFFYTWFEKAPARLELKVTGGLIAHYRDRGNVRIDLYAVGGGQETLVAHDESIPPDGKQRTVTLASDRAGLHKLVVNDGGDKTEVIWPQGQARTCEASKDAAGQSDRRSGYFYVPRGTRTVGGYGSPGTKAEIRDADGKAAFRFEQLDGPDYFGVSVPEGQDGRLWSFHGVVGAPVLLTVPPYFARHPDELLLPRKTLEADGLR